jgi:TolB-like protein/Tfp pilus assembly protein PilF
MKRKKSRGREKPSAFSEGKPFFKALLIEIKEKKIIEILGGFIGVGWLILEFVHWILIDHYHFPEWSLDITFVTLIAALVMTLLWRLVKSNWLVGLAVVLIGAATVFIDVRIVQKGEPHEVKEPLATSHWKNSIAVLPFADISPQRDQEYFCDGITEELINALSNVKELRVVARTSVFSLKGKEMDIREIGQKLNVATILEGSVRKADNRLRITVQLINVADGYHLWSEEFERQMDDIFTIQDEISMAIVDKLKVELLEGEKERLVQVRTADIDAYNLYLRGKWFWNKRGKENLMKAIKCFQEAIKIDPSYAQAYAGLADAYMVFPDYSNLPSAKYFSLAKEAALQALELDDQNIEASIVLAMINIYNWQWDEGEKTLKRIIARYPNSSLAHYYYSETLFYQGNFPQAIEERKKVLELDPLSFIGLRNLGITYYYDRQYDNALKMLQKAEELNPTDFWNLAYIALVCSDLGDYDRADEYLSKAGLQPATQNYYLSLKGIFLSRTGQREEAAQILKSLEAKYQSHQEYISPFFIALLCITLGENEKGFHYLEEAYISHDQWLRYVKVVPLFAPVRSDPRYQSLLKQVGYTSELIF